MSTDNITCAVASLDDCLDALDGARYAEEAPAGVLALAAVRVRDLRDVLAQWEVQ